VVKQELCKARPSPLIERVTAAAARHAAHMVVVIDTRPTRLARRIAMARAS
jgi:hypothetical protein